MATEVVVHTQGDVSDAERNHARDKVTRVFDHAPGPVLYAKVDVVRHSDPARERSVFAKAELDVNGRMVRAHAAAPTTNEAIDALEARLRERVEHAAHVEESRHLRHRDAPESWHRGDLPTARPAYFPRAVEERTVVRRKTFSVGDQTPREAALDMALLDHDFFLFRNVETGEDNVLVRSPEGLALIEPTPGASQHATETAIDSSPIHPPTMDLDDAIDLLNAGDEPFVFFLDPGSGRGCVVYRRYDGHYGVIESSAA